MRTRQSRVVRYASLITLATVELLASFAPSQARGDGPVSKQVEELREQVAEQRRLIERLTELSEQQQRQIEQLQRAVATDSRSPTVHLGVPADLRNLGIDAADLQGIPIDAMLSGPVDPASAVRSRIEPTASSFSTEQREELERRIAGYLASNPAPPGESNAGYANGFVIAGPQAARVGAQDIPFQLRINGRIQLRHTGFDSDGPNDDENNFEFERARLVFSGHAYAPELTYFIQLDGDSDDSESIDLLDYYGSYDLGYGLLGCEKDRIGVKAGKWKLPFSRARQESGFALNFADRSMASEFFDINRSIGVGLFGRCDVTSRPVNWEIAMFNGYRTEGFRPGRSGDLDRNFGYAARVYSDIAGEWGRDGEPDLSYHECPAVRVGTAVAFTRVDENEGRREFLRQLVTDSGATLDSLLPAAVEEFDVLFYAVDANYKYRGFSLLSEYYFRVITEFAGASVADLFDHGFVVQAGYFVCREKLELLARWSRVVGDSGTLGDHDHSADELAGGVAWYMRGHHVKLVFDVSHLNGAPINSTAVNIRPGDDGWLYRTQLQLSF